MRPTIAQVCSLPAPFQEDVREYAAAQCGSLEIWLTKLENALQQHSVDDLKRLLLDEQMAVPVASIQGGLLDSQGPARKEAWDLLTRRLQLCQQLGVETLVVACDVTGPVEAVTAERVHMSLVQLAQAASASHMRVALEFQSDSALGNNLQTAAAMVAEVGSPHLGLCFDAFHYYVGPSKPDDLGYLTAENLFHVQLCDLADIPRELARDSHRILPGDGDIPLAPVLDRLREIDYRGCVSIELFNAQIWQIKPRAFSEIAITSLRKLLGQASM